VAARRVQFNVRVREEVAKDLRNEAALRAIGMGELVELLNENYRAGTRSGHWLELDPTLEAALTALAAVHGEEPEQVLQNLVAGIVREQLQRILDHMPRTEDILTGAAAASLGRAAEQVTVDPENDFDEIEIDASAWIEPSESDVAIEAMEWDDPSDADLEIEAGEFIEDEAADEVAEPGSRPATDSRWEGQVERRRRSREALLSTQQQEQLDALPEGLPRTGDELRRFRQQQGLNAAQLGALCGVTQVAVGLWEKKGPLPAPILLKLGQGLARYFSN